jgi:hypothetical protein
LIDPNVIILGGGERTEVVRGSDRNAFRRQLQNGRNFADTERFWNFHGWNF